MSLRIVHYNHPVLRTKGEKVNAFDDALARLAEEMIETMHDARGIGLAALQIADTTRLDTCNALYLGASFASADTPVREPEVLTISDAKSFAEHGGMIELFTENHRLRFLINVENAHQAGLRISSDLLKLAAGVQRGRR